MYINTIVLLNLDYELRGQTFTVTLRGSLRRWSSYLFETSVYPSGGVLYVGDSAKGLLPFLGDLLAVSFEYTINTYYEN